VEKKPENKQHWQRGNDEQIDEERWEHTKALRQRLGSILRGLTAWLYGRALSFPRAILKLGGNLQQFMFEGWVGRRCSGKTGFVSAFLPEVNTLGGHACPPPESQTMTRRAVASMES